jgi:Ca2+/H+ antiporter
MNARVKEQSMTGTLVLGAALLAGLAVMIASLFRKRKA